MARMKGGGRISSGKPYSWASLLSCFCRRIEYLGAVHDLAFGEGLEGANGLIGEEKGTVTISPVGVRVEGDSRARKDSRGVLLANVFAEASLEVAMMKSS